MEWVLSNLPSVLFLILFIGVTVYQIRSMRGAPAGMKKYVPTGNNKVSFDDIGGIENAKAEILSVVDAMKNWKMYSDRGLRPPRGVIMDGPPGTGKTLLAKAIASELGADMWISTGNDFRSKFVSEGGQKVKAAFAKAREIAERTGRVGILFIDEVDTVLGKRGNS